MRVNKVGSICYRLGSASPSLPDRRQEKTDQAGGRSHYAWLLMDCQYMDLFLGPVHRNFCSGVVNLPPANGPGSLVSKGNFPAGKPGMVPHPPGLASRESPSGGCCRVARQVSGVKRSPLQPVCARALLSRVRLGAGQSGALRYQVRSYRSRPFRYGLCIKACSFPASREARS